MGILSKNIHFAIFLLFCFAALPLSLSSQQTDTNDYIITPKYVAPSYKGGFDELIRYIESQQLNISSWDTPPDLYELKVQIELQISEEGKISSAICNCFPIQNALFEMKIEEIFLNSPNWRAAEENGKPVSQNISFNIMLFKKGNTLQIERFENYHIVGHDSKIKYKITIIAILASLFIIKLIFS